MKTTLTDAEKTALERYNYDDVILYIRGAGINAKNWHVGEFGFLYVSIASITRNDMLLLAGAIPNNFTIIDGYEDSDNYIVMKGLCIRFCPMPKTSTRSIDDWL